MRTRSLRDSFLVGIASLAAGCATGSGSGTADDPIAIRASHFAAPFEPWMKPHVEALYREGEWGAVLHFQGLGLAAMEHGRFDLAEFAFDEAIARVEAIYANDENASRARSTFGAERIKDFKGEPHERSMLYYYRGLLFLREEDFQNARAAFLAADRHDTLSYAESQTYAGDFGMMKYLAGWASACDGDEARADQLLAEARAADASLATLPPRPGHSLVLIDVGSGPRKIAAGEHQEILRFEPGDPVTRDIALDGHDGMPLPPLLPLGDVNFQATTRGGREIDGVLDGKARFKSASGAVGDVAFDTGAQMAVLGSLQGDQNLSNAGLVGMLLGVVARGVSDATVAQADIRTWAGLPSQVLMYADDDIVYRARGFSGPGIAGNADFILRTRGPVCSIAWGRGGTVASREFALDPLFLEAEQTRTERNRALRALLADRLGTTRTASGL